MDPSVSTRRPLGGTGGGGSNGSSGGSALGGFFHSAPELSVAASPPSTMIRLLPVSSASSGVLPLHSTANGHGHVGLSGSSGTGSLASSLPATPAPFRGAASSFPSSSTIPVPLRSGLLQGSSRSASTTPAIGGAPPVLVPQDEEAARKLLAAVLDQQGRNQSQSQSQLQSRASGPLGGVGQQASLAQVAVSTPRGLLLPSSGVPGAVASRLQIPLTHHTVPNLKLWSQEQLHAQQTLNSQSKHPQVPPHLTDAAFNNYMQQFQQRTRTQAPQQQQQPLQQQHQLQQQQQFQLFYQQQLQQQAQLAKKAPRESAEWTNSLPSTKKRRVTKVDQHNPQFHEQLSKVLNFNGNPKPMWVSNNCVISSLGSVVHEYEDYHTETNIFPTGYCCFRWDRSAKTPNTNCIYKCEILGQGPQPLFKITPFDDEEHYVASTNINECWAELGRRFPAHKQDYGLHFFGLDYPLVNHLIQQLPDASKCIKYKTKICTLNPSVRGSMPIQQKMGTHNQQVRAQISHSTRLNGTSIISSFSTASVLNGTQYRNGSQQQSQRAQSSPGKIKKEASSVQPLAEVIGDLVPSHPIKHFESFINFELDPELFSLIKNLPLNDQFRGVSEEEEPLQVQLRCFATTLNLDANAKCAISVNNHTLVPGQQHKEPININKYCQKGRNVLRIVCNSLAPNYVLCTSLMRCRTARELLEVIRRSPCKPTLEQLREKVRGSFKTDGEVEQISMALSLCCPITRERIQTPGRSLSCSHVQCFDLQTFIRFSLKPTNKRRWMCPLCDKFLPFETLFEDEFCKEILDNVIDHEVKEVELLADGSWKEPHSEKDEKDYVDLTSDVEDDVIHDLTRTICIKQEIQPSMDSPETLLASMELLQPNILDSNWIGSTSPAPSWDEPHIISNGHAKVLEQQKTPEEEFVDKALSLEDSEVDAWVGFDLNDSLNNSTGLATQAAHTPQPDFSSSTPDNPFQLFSQNHGELELDELGVLDVGFEGFL